MKKILIAVVFLLISTALVAQSNTAATNQTGDDNSANVNQTGSTNTSTVNQLDGENAATVDQTGDLNTADVNQRTTWSALANNVDIDQLGNSNYAQAEQWNGGNQAIVLQDDAAGANNWARISQAQNSNYAKIWQNGSDNHSAALTNGGNTIHNITQVGDENIGTAASYGGGNKATISQTGNNNDAGVLPYYAGPEGIYQLGMLNEAAVTVVGDENSTFVSQEGDGNGVLMEVGVYGGASFNSADFTQLGNDNYLETKMVSAENNNVVGTQDGNNNLFRVGIRGDDNTVNMLAEGNQNRGSWNFSSPHPEYPTHNALDIAQDGNQNLTNGAVDGDYNDIDIIQTGDGNSVGTLWYGTDGVNITGDHNDVDISQTGTGLNKSFNSITGSNNTISVIQTN